MAEEEPVAHEACQHCYATLERAGVMWRRVGPDGEMTCMKGIDSGDVPHKPMPKILIA